MPILTRIFVVTSLVLLPLVGCGGGGLPDGETGTVSGLISFKGNPIPAGCTVIFLPAAGGGAVMATGVTDESGAYSLTMRNGPEILAGTYRVGVTPPTSEPQMSPEEFMELEKAPETPPPPFPPKYLNAETSGLTLDVKAGENKLDIQLVE